MKKSGEKSGSDTSKNVKSGGTKRVLTTDDPAATPSQLRQPNERDESADQQLSGTRRVINKRTTTCKAGNKTPMRATVSPKSRLTYPRRGEL